MSNLKILIVGASIAGPMTAYWFAQAGAHVTVIERFPQFRTNGHNVDIRTIGVTVMRKIPGMEEAVRAKRAPISGISFRNSDDSVYATMMSSGNADQQSLVSEYEIFRGDLSQILYDLTKDKVRYVFGEQIVSMQHHSDSITCEFMNGMPSETFDLVVACDGATSRTRAMGLGCGVRDHVKRLNSWAAYFSMKPDFVGQSTLAQFYSAPGGRWLAVGPDPAGGVDRAGIMLIQPRDEVDRTAPLREVLKQSNDELKHYISREFKGAGWQTEKLMKAMMEADDLYASEIVQVKCSNLSKGRFVMVGDAGYCPSNFTGAGTSLAIGGAYVLAGEIGKHQGDLEAGLRAYEERMWPIIKDMQSIPPIIPGILAPQTAWGVWTRNLLFTCVSWAMSTSSYFSWIGNPVGGLLASLASSFGGDKYSLPDYDISLAPEEQK